MKSHQNLVIQRLNTEGVSETEDILAVEEPLEISVAYGKVGERQRKTIAVTMRTPDFDFELALGFLYTEGVIFSKKDILNIRYIHENSVLIDLNENLYFDTEKLNRHFYTTSSCGVCGKASLEAVSTQMCYFLQKNYPIVKSDILSALPMQLFDNQLLFSKTGGVHASTIFNTEGLYIHLFEDVGRHNALDKLIGWALKMDMLPLSNHILLVSGRASFELMQKAAMAGIPIVAAIGAPSSLAVQLAAEMNMTLIGFLRENKFNIYTGKERITKV